MLDKEWAIKFAEDWIDSWNSKDLERILSHYTEDFEMTSPLIIERLGKKEGKLKGKQSVKEYWLPSLKLEPPLFFELIDVLVGVSELTLYYKSVNRRVVAETIFINDQGKIVKGISQWSVLNKIYS